MISSESSCRQLNAPGSMSGCTSSPRANAVRSRMAPTSFAGLRRSRDSHGVTATSKAGRWTTSRPTCRRSPPSTREPCEAPRSKINPDLRFFPVLYHDDYGDEFLASYAPYLDGAIFPYTIDFDKADARRRGIEANRRQARQVRPRSGPDGVFHENECGRVSAVGDLCRLTPCGPDWRR